MKTLTFYDASQPHLVLTDKREWRVYCYNNSTRQLVILKIGKCPQMRVKQARETAGWILQCLQWTKHSITPTNPSHHTGEKTFLIST